jgi:Planctomycete cytochrome C
MVPQTTDKKMKQLSILFFIALAFAISLSSCYYDKEEILYPDTVCDTSTIRYSTSIVPILSANCISCHGGNTPSAGIRLDNYAAVRVQAANGKLWGSISHTAGFAAMPKNSGQLGTCNLTKVKKWLAAGYPDN